ncbi:crosslink repair DNA glycosylase YcaQ family protein [Pelagicoccus sp. SDUM812005]|uniref:DNA glycosylase AlkZ-like family protein n=1 Tax=Pelagicoccus sp. SDUM812005 TaxID=3041257 RepID=UPI00280DE6A2|nr:crosslink repair DNA glycosylase YcaQ family protein [Pelagicoccus sp. SDUM812005]MDQ8181745.1 crosslink repair DNA glycosylase YcaQ family protein [Pelagicoccus sp. SDUM812005]
MAGIEQLGVNAFRRRLVAGSFPVYPDLDAALAGLQFVQADPIRCPARAQDLMLRQRVAAYLAGDLEARFPEMSAEEGYLFAYGIMTPELWRSVRGGGRAKLDKLERAVLDAVGEWGEAHPRDLDERFGTASVRNYWGGKSKASKRVLEDLHDAGLLRVCRREKGVRVYQVPPASDASELSPRERYRSLLLATAHVFGPTSARFLISELGYHRSLLAARRERLEVLDGLREEGILQELVVEGVSYVWIRDEWMNEEVPERARILAPFDPLVRNRERFEQVWGWTYRFEAYVPAAKRERGYYAMPLLWKDRVLGWANAKVEAGHLKVALGYVGKRPREKAFRLAVENEVEALAKFLGLGSGAWELAF